jgi:hypothetical protein
LRSPRPALTYGELRPEGTAQTTTPRAHVTSIGVKVAGRGALMDAPLGLPIQRDVDIGSLLAIVGTQDNPDDMTAI